MSGGVIYKPPGWKIPDHKQDSLGLLEDCRGTTVPCLFTLSCQLLHAQQYHYIKRMHKLAVLAFVMGRCGRQPAHTHHIPDDV